MQPCALIFWSIFVLAPLAPGLVGAVCLFALVLQTLTLLVRCAAPPAPRRLSAPQSGAPQPVFSVHLATHNEPPALVAKTLRALAAQDYPAHGFEVVVIDNNTQDPALWTPLERLCRAFGPQFTFRHAMGVRGAKAGALNIALDQTRRDATHIVIVDADYVTHPRFLSEAADALRRTGADYVQFPQAYRREAGVAQGPDLELEEYFRTQVRMADDAEALLLTGTLSVISKPALQAVGGWSGRTTTEDAELGVRLCRAGYAGRYVDRVVGRGLLPFSLRELSTQRYRWASGNLRTLLHHAAMLRPLNRRLRWRQTAAIVTQLSAWLNLSLIPAAAFLSALIFPAFDSPALRGIAAMSILICLCDILIRLAARGLSDGHRLNVMASTCATRIALAPAAARATVDACLPIRLRFAVTGKDATATAQRRALPNDLMVLMGLVLLAAPAALQSGPVVAAAWIALALPLPAALLTELQLARYRADHSACEVMS